MSKHGPRNWSTIRRPSPECQIYSRWTRPAAAPTRVNSTGEDPGTIPSFGCIAGVTAFLTLVHAPARIPVPQVLQMNCVPRSVWSTSPVGKPPRVVAAMPSAVMTRARALLLTHGVSKHSTRVRITHGTQVDPALGAPQVGQIRDPHPIQGTLVPLAGAVILMGHRTPPAAPHRARVCIQVRETLAAHRRGDRPHTHIHTRARQSMADTWRPIGAARHLVFPGHRLIQTPPRRCALTPLGCTALPRVIARSRDT